MAWNGKQEWDVARHGLDVMFEKGRLHALSEWKKGYRAMDGWIAENALDRSFAAGYAHTWRRLEEFASLGLSAESLKQ